MLNLPLPLRAGLGRDSGELVARGVFQALASLPIVIDPTDSLMRPGKRSLHSVHDVLVPLGDHQTPGHFFQPHAASGAAVLLVHGTTAEKPLPYYFFIRELLRAGIAVMTFELDGHGANPRPICGSGIATNVPAALSLLLQRPEVDARRVGMMGVSLGGACVLNAAPDFPALRAIATLSTPHSVALDQLNKLLEVLGTLNPECLESCFEASPGPLLEFVRSEIRIAASLDDPHERVDLLHPGTMPHIDAVIQALDPLGKARQLGDMPLLVVNGAWDQITPAWQARDLYRRAPGAKQLAIVPRRNHLTLMTSQVAVQTTVDWFRQWL